MYPRRVLTLTIPPPAFSGIDGFLAYQRAAVSSARAALDDDALAVWRELGADRRALFLSRLAHEDDGLALWRRAWWLYAIGSLGAPFDAGIEPEQRGGFKRAVASAFAPHAPPPDRPRALAAWWRDVLSGCRQYIAGYVAARIASSAGRLRADGIIDEAVRAELAALALERSGDNASRTRAMTPRTTRPRAASRSDRRRVLEAAAEVVSAHRSLDRRFADLGSVCAACTRETGGCCSLTVPLIWREADFRLLALGGVEAPSPDEANGGSCPFLGDTGCRLPSDRRPHICRSFLCERAEAALGDGLGAVRADLQLLNAARSRLG